MDNITDILIRVAQGRGEMPLSEIEINQRNQELVESYKIKSISIDQLKSGEAVLFKTQTGSTYVVRIDGKVFKLGVKIKQVFNIQSHASINLGSSLFSEDNQANSSGINEIHIIADPEILKDGGELTHFTPFSDYAFMVEPVEIKTKSSIYRLEKAEGKIDVYKNKELIGICYFVKTPDKVINFNIGEQGFIYVLKSNGKCKEYYTSRIESIKVLNPQRT